MTGPWLDIIGVTEGGIEALPETLQKLVAEAKTVLGPERLLPKAMPHQDVRAWTPPLQSMIEQVNGCRGSKTVVLATGDPNWFGIGVTLGRHLEVDEFALHPAPGAFQLTAARLKWPLQAVQTLSLHGRPVATLHPHIVPGNCILALTANAGTLAEVCVLLKARGYGRSRLHVFENLGGSGENRQSFVADAKDIPQIGDFYTLAIECVADPGAALLPPVPGLPDDAFESDGQLTKREVRAATLASLMPYPDALLWDVGGGAGSVGIEWMRAAPRARAICFERHGDRCAMIEANARNLGTPSLKIIPGDAPQSLGGQPSPDAIFWGGDLDNQELFTALWDALRPGGHLVANAVTVSGRQMLFALEDRVGGTLTENSISRLDKVGQQKIMRPKMPVLQWTVQKPEGGQ